MSTGNERRSSSPTSPSPSPLYCDFGLGLKMPLQPTESYTCDVGGGGPLFSCSGNRVSDCAGDASYRNTLFFQNTSSPRATSVGATSGKALFTESQWQELERQNLIHRYILASIPVPPQLLFLPLHHLLHPQCNSLDLRFGSGGSSDLEPWRCKRTDGKKWRCSRDVVPDHKYCERHARKNKPRSRKHVEISSSPSPSPSPILPPPNHHHHHHHHPFQRSSHISPSYDQTRSIDWFMRGGNSITKPQQQMMQMPSPGSEPDKDHEYSITNKNYDDKQGFYIPDTSTLQRQENHQQMDSPQTTTRHFFVDAWEKDIGFHMGIGSKIKKLSPPSSLSLSMSGYNGNNCGIRGYDQDNDDDNEDDDGVNGHLGIGTMTSASASWMNSMSSPTPPGGPLGEALCLGGNASTTTRGGNSNLASPYSNNTNSSSKSSCEDGSHAHNFIWR